MVVDELRISLGHVIEKVSKSKFGTLSSAFLEIVVGIEGDYSIIGIEASKRINKMSAHKWIKVTGAALAVSLSVSSPASVIAHNAF